MKKVRVYDFESREMWIADGYDELSELFMALNTDDSIFSEPMQSTGLADENGKEIFDGDIIQTERYFDGFTDVKLYKGVVKQLDGLWIIDTGNDAVPVFSEIEENIVIGNIWEEE